MTQTSFYWEGTVLGDAILAPYTEAIYHSLWRKMFLRDRATQGVIRDYLNELVVTGISGGVSVATGAALVDGFFYENDAPVTVDIPTPAASTRVDLIVLRKDPTAQTVRITRIVGTEGAGRPSLTQLDGGTWDLELAQVSITTAGVITVTDFRDIAQSTLIPKISSLEVIEEILSDGSIFDFDFQNIPDTYKHLLVLMHGKCYETITPSTNLLGEIEFNGDTVVTNYAFQAVFALGAGAISASADNDNPSVAGFPNEALGAGAGGWAGQSWVWIPYYAQTDFYKVFGSKFTQTDQTGNVRIFNTGIWENTAAINRVRIEFQSDDNILLTFSKAVLYGRT